MSPLQANAIVLFKTEANKMLESTKSNIANGTHHEFYNDRNMIAQGYDDIVTEVMKSLFGDDFLDFEKKCDDCIITYESLRDLSNDLTNDEFDLVSA